MANSSRGTRVHHGGGGVAARAESGEPMVSSRHRKQRGKLKVGKAINSINLPSMTHFLSRKAEPPKPPQTAPPAEAKC